MKTIEERAHEYGCKAAGGHYVGGVRGSIYENHQRAYKEIAKEQQTIDIDKACSAYCITRCGYINAENCKAKPCACMATFKELMKGE